MDGEHAARTDDADGAPVGTGSATPAAAGVVQALARRHETLAVAESLTGGALAAAVVDVPGASAVLRGAVVAYATDLKHALLGVDAALLARQGAVHPEVAGQMADGVRTRLSATWGVATTGVAGPDPQDGRPPGTVHVALAGPQGVTVESLTLPGNRAQVRSRTVAVALELLGRALGPAVQPRA
jgi:nicotinamide-nucleotide amidase